MDILHEQVAGLDVHKNTVVACVRMMTGKETARECRTFATTTDGLLALRAWLSESRCTHVAMEATGVYWTPVWRILNAGDFELTVANAAHIKNVPGRKTDMNDAMWLADLVAFGLIKASFVPTEPMHELRSLTRTRKQLVREQTRHVQRIQKTLAEANIRLDSVISDVMGASGRRIIEAMIAGVRQPHKLADLAGKQIKATPKELYDALHGRLTDHHRFLLELHLRQWDGLDASIRTIDLEIDQRIRGIDEQRRAGEPPFRALIENADTVPGVSAVSAPAILSEIGTDMSRFPTAGHLLAWAGMCPEQNESAGRRKSSRLRKGAPWLKTMLVQCAWAAVRKKGSYYQAQFVRLRHRRGPQKAICAVAASILTAIYHMLKNGTEHHDLGANHFDRRSTEVKAKSLVARLKKLGFTVQLQPTPKAA
ncbi:transposase [Bradyrhizobium sp. S3.2.6]|uniref:IS110 family transposase n=1 Tax=Bradyrhizobium sp. S3.2.6 TaxID=3156428 RepID=UPI003395BD4B